MKVIDHNSHVLYFTYRFQDKTEFKKYEGLSDTITVNKLMKNKILKYIYMDYNNFIYYGEFDLDNPITKKDLEILNFLKKEYSPKSRFFSKQSNTQCGFNDFFEDCCCDRKMRDLNAPIFAGRKYHLSKYYNNLYLSENKFPRNCQHPMFENWKGTPLLAIRKLNNEPVKCGLKRRRYYVKEGVINKKKGLLFQSLLNLNNIHEARKNNLNTDLKIISNSLWDNLKVIKVFDLNGFFKDIKYYKNKKFMIKIALSDEIKNIFNLFEKKNLDVFDLNNHFNKIKINNKLFKISPL